MRARPVLNASRYTYWLKDIDSGMPTDARMAYRLSSLYADAQEEAYIWQDSHDNDA